MQTVVRTYKDQSNMQADIQNMEKYGWPVVNVQHYGQGYAPVKTIALGMIFLPLALFGKKGDVFQVTYQRGG